ncbi:MAG: hypothetical protein ACR2FY_06620 [Pirellulaceae bacterium]
MNLPKPKRRWYQFSLLSLMLATTLLGVVLGVGLLCIAPAERQRVSARKAANLREGFGGAAGYEGRAKDESWLTRGLREWLPRDYFERVIDLWLNESNVTDADLPHLHGFTHLEMLNLKQTQVTDAGLVHLQAFKHLTVLNLNSTHVTDAGLTHLYGLSQLGYLDLTGTKVTDEGIEKLQKALPNCEIHR